MFTLQPTVFWCLEPARSIMADEEVSTRAPESDAQDSIVPGDTKAQEGPSMGVRSQLDR